MVEAREIARRLTVSTTDYHTAGEPFRIVTGAPGGSLEGRTVLERRGHVAEHADHLRQLLVNEPRGHADMYGGFVVPPDDQDAELGVVFFHNEGYSTACGHGTIALVTWAIESGYLSSPGTGERQVAVDVPSGRVSCVAQVRSGRVEEVTMRNVPSFVLHQGIEVTTSRGAACVDVAFGGAFYASLPAEALGLRICRHDLPALIQTGREIKSEVDTAREVVHPEERRLHGIYGVIFHAEVEDVAPGDDGRGMAQRNVTVFADGEVDRSPCGSGTSARLALLHAQRRLATGAVLRHRSIVDTEFTGVVTGVTSVGNHDAVSTEITGRASLTGHHTFVLTAEDELGLGFQLR